MGGKTSEVGRGRATGLRRAPGVCEEDGRCGWVMGRNLGVGGYIMGRRGGAEARQVSEGVGQPLHLRFRKKEPGRQVSRRNVEVSGGRIWHIKSQILGLLS